MEKKRLHIINSNGQKKDVPYSGEDCALEDTCGYFIVDDEWYLSHGYVTLEQHKKHLEESMIRKEQT